MNILIGVIGILLGIWGLIILFAAVEVWQLKFPWLSRFVIAANEVLLAAFFSLIVLTVALFDWVQRHRHHADRAIRTCGKLNPRILLSPASLR